jgi:hypothetical protein
MRMSFTLVLALCAGMVLGGETAFTSSEYGFTIKPPVQEKWSGSGVVATFMLPPIAGFSDNVNVMVQEFAGTLSDYDQLTKKQFEQNAMTVHASQLAKEVLIYEYSGKFQGRALHWYSRAYQKDGKVYLITATCAEERWEKNKALLIESVDSFALKK